MSESTYTPRPVASALVAVYDPVTADIVAFAGHEHELTHSVEVPTRGRRELVSFANRIAGLRRGPVLVSLLLRDGELKAQSFAMSGAVTHQSPIEVHRSVLSGDLKGEREDLDNSWGKALTGVLEKMLP